MPVKSLQDLFVEELRERVGLLAGPAKGPAFGETSFGPALVVGKRGCHGADDPQPEEEAQAQPHES